MTTFTMSLLSLKIGNWLSTLNYFSSFAAVKIGKKSVHLRLLANDGALFLPIFTAAKDEKYFRISD